MKQTCLILFGGQSSEYPVSLQSAAAVIDAINQSNYTVLCVGITQTGQWLLYPGDTAAIRDGSWLQNKGCVPAVLSPSREDHGLWLLSADSCEKRTVDVVFPVLHGRFGEDGTVQGLLELAGIPFVGCGSLSSAMCMDKAVAHTLAAAAGVPCPRFYTLYADSSSPASLALRVLAAFGDVAFPWYVKPACEGSSFGITRVENKDGLATALATALRYSKKVVVEEGVPGFEVGCAVLGNEQRIVGEIDAISLQTGFFDYHEKYNLETAQILLPAPITAQQAAEVKRLAVQVYTLLECRGLARVDFFLTPDGTIVFNEVNTIPGMTSHSRYPNMLKEAGIPFATMVEMLLKNAQA